MLRIMLSAAAVFGLSGVTLADTIFVSPGGSIQAAIDVSEDGDEIVVSAGTFVETINLQGKAVTLRSTAGATSTTIDGNGAGSVIKCDQNEGADTVIDGFTITGGTGTQLGVRKAGGGILLFGSEPTIVNCVVKGNEADDGGGMYNFVGDPDIYNCVFYDNTSTGFVSGGGAVFNNFSNALFVNCTFAANSAADGGGIYNDTSVPRLINCVVWNNTPDAFSGSDAPIVTYSNIQGDFSGTGNIDFDPVFVDEASGNLQIQAGSPCIDRGDSVAIAVDYFTDASGDPRGVDDPASLDRGIAVFALNVDMGAYEYQVDPVDSCPGDVDGPAGVPDGEITFFDLIRVLSGWGPCP